MISRCQNIVPSLLIQHRTMKSSTIICCLFVVKLLVVSCAPQIGNDTKFQPNWKSLDTRNIPLWYDEAKIGIILHWGVYSVPSYCTEWMWYLWKVGRESKCVKFVENHYRKGWSYQEFAKDFTAEFFNPDEWAEIFKESGVKYVVLTTKHHDGYALWPSKYSFSWNAKDIGPHRDLVGDLGTAVKKQKLHYGLYHSMFEWFHPLYLSDAASNFNESYFVNDKVYPELVELVENYKPDILWSDGDKSANDTYWRSQEFLAWLYNESPVKDTVVVNDRWGNGIPCHHGDFFTCKDSYNPKVLQHHKWENIIKIDKLSWAYERTAKLDTYMTIKELLTVLAETISCGGNLLINVGPTKDGMIAPIFQDRLLSLGSWLKINGEAIYASKPWKVQHDKKAKVWYTSKANAVYVIVLSWPTKNFLNLHTVADIFQKSDVRVVILGNSDKLKWTKNGETVEIHFPNKATVNSKWSWVLKITNY